MIPVRDLMPWMLRLGIWVIFRFNEILLEKKEGPWDTHLTRSRNGVLSPYIVTSLLVDSSLLSCRNESESCWAFHSKCNHNKTTVSRHVFVSRRRANSVLFAEECASPLTRMRDWIDGCMSAIQEWLHPEERYCVNFWLPAAYGTKGNPVFGVLSLRHACCAKLSNTSVQASTHSRAFGTKYS